MGRLFFGLTQQEYKSSSLSLTECVGLPGVVRFDLESHYEIKYA